MMSIQRDNVPLLHFYVCTLNISIYNHDDDDPITIQHIESIYMVITDMTNETNRDTMEFSC